MRATDERGSGSLLGLAIVGSLIGVVSVTLPLYIGLSARAALSDAAAAAALGAADVASGIAPGSPCATAAAVAAANGASAAACQLDGLVVTVRLDREYLGLQLAASATAGPPGVGTN